MEEKKSFLDGLKSAAGDRNIQQFLAQLGTEIDPQGAGGAIGRPTSALIETQSAQANLDELVKALQGLGKGGKIRTKPDGSTEISMGESALQPTESGLGNMGGLADQPVLSDQTSTAPQLQADQPGAKAPTLDHLTNDLYNKLFGGI